MRKKLFTLTAAAPDRLQVTNPDFVSDFHEILNQFWSLANQYFNEEERLLRTAAYPDLSAHLEAHATFRSQLTEVLYQAIRGNYHNQGLLDQLSRLLRHFIDTGPQCRSFLKAPRG